MILFSLLYWQNHRKYFHSGVLVIKWGPNKNGWYLANNILKGILMHYNSLIEISLKLVQRFTWLNLSQWSWASKIACLVSGFWQSFLVNHIQYVLKNAKFYQSGKWKLLFKLSPGLLKCPIGNMSSLVQVMAWHPLGAKPFPEAMVTQIHDAIWHH